MPKNSVIGINLAEVTNEYRALMCDIPLPHLLSRLDVSFQNYGKNSMIGLFFFLTRKVLIYFFLFQSKTICCGIH